MIYRNMYGNPPYLPAASTENKNVILLYLVIPIAPSCNTFTEVLTASTSGVSVKTIKMYYFDALIYNSLLCLQTQLNSLQ